MRVASTLGLLVLALLAVYVSGQAGPPCLNPVLGPGQAVGGCTLAPDSLTCDLACLPGLTQYGNLTLYCQAGVWNYSIATGACVVPTCASNYPSGSNISPGTCVAGTAHMQQCTVNCTAGAGSASAPALNTVCNNGTFTPIAPGTCASCANGTYNDIIGPSCKLCPSLAISVGGIGATACACQGGSYQANPSPLQCVACDPFAGVGCFGVACSGPGSTYCAQCLPGWTGSGTFTCTMCQANQYCSNAACSSCANCNPFSTSPPASTSAASCQCVPGYGSDLNLPPSCTRCSAGTYEQNHACVLCDNGGRANTYSPSGATNSSSCICDAGYGLTGNPSPNLCQGCTNTQYGYPGSGVCRTCPPFSTGGGPFSSQCSCTGGYNSVITNYVQSCNRIFFNWNVDDWGTCSGTCGEGPARQRGVQDRYVYCVNNATGQPAPGYCTSTPPDSQRPCDKPCPAMPTGVQATAYFESAFVTWNVPPQNYTNLGPCVNGYCLDGGVCDNSTGLFFCRLDTFGWAVTSDPDNIYVFSRSGRTNGMQGVLVKGLTSGRRYTFTVRLVTYPVIDYYGNTVNLQSEPSTPSNLVSVTSNLQCFGGCSANGRCVAGECICDPGYTGPSCGTYARVSFNITSGLVYDRAGSPPLRANISIDPPELAFDIYLFEAKCKNLDWCVPSDIDNELRSAQLPSTANGFFVVTNSNAWDTPAGEYFGRLYVSNRNDFWADSEIFTLTDNYCDFNPCLNGATCSKSTCECALGFTGARCEIQIDPCTQVGLDCSGQYSSGCNFGTRKCICVLGWHGDSCEYPPTWSLTCKNGGTPTNPDNVADFESCSCDTPWTGLDCSTCDIDCLNGGTSLGCKLDPTNPTGFPTYCKCPAFFDGPTCGFPYVSAYITLEGTNNLDDDNEDDFVRMVTEDILESLEINDNTDPGWRIVTPVDHSSSGAKIEIRFYQQQPYSSTSAQDSGVLLRNRFVAQVNDPNSYFHVQTLSGAVTGTSVTTTNPSQSIPDKYHSSSGNDDLALKTALPIILGLLFIIIMVIIIRKYCCNKESGRGGGQEMTDTSGQAARS